MFPLPLVTLLLGPRYLTLEVFGFDVYLAQPVCQFSRSECTALMSLAIAPILFDADWHPSNPSSMLPLGPPHAAPFCSAAASNLAFTLFSATPDGPTPYIKIAQTHFSVVSFRLTSALSSSSSSNCTLRVKFSPVVLWFSPSALLDLSSLIFSSAFSSEVSASWSLC